MRSGEGAHEGSIRHLQRGAVPSGRVDSPPARPADEAARRALLRGVSLPGGGVARAGWCSACGLGVAYLLAAAPLAYLWRSLRPLLLLLAITFVIQAVTLPGKALASWGPFSVTAEGLARGGFLTVRLALLLFSSTLLTLCTAPVALTDGVEWLLRPLRRLGLPTHEVALMMTIALRFIPTLLRQLDDLHQGSAGPRRRPAHARPLETGTGHPAAGGAALRPQLPPGRRPGRGHDQPVLPGW